MAGPSRGRDFSWRWPRALLLQLAHPWVAAAIAQHSRALADPIGRFHRTFNITFTLVFGTLDEALRAARHLRRQGMMHDAGLFFICYQRDPLTALVQTATRQAALAARAPRYSILAGREEVASCVGRELVQGVEFGDVVGS